MAKAIGRIFDKVLERVGFDQAVERGGVKKALAKSKYDASSIVSKLVFYTLFLLVLQLAFGVFGANPVSDLITGIVAYLPKVFAAVVIVVVAAAVAAAVKEIVESALGGLSYGRTAAVGISVAILTVGAFAALSRGRRGRRPCRSRRCRRRSRTGPAASAPGPAPGYGHRHRPSAAAARASARPSAAGPAATAPALA